MPLRAVALEIKSADKKPLCMAFSGPVALQ
jgi:hypothetical protein